MSNIAIIMPTYNGARFVAEAAQSVLRQTVTDWTLTIIDDGSTDGGAGADAAEAIAALPQAAGRIRVLRNLPNQGIAGARNHGFRVATSTGSPGEKAEFVLFLDHDDLLKPDALATLRSLAQKNPESPAVHGIASPITASGTPHPWATTFEAYQRDRFTLGRWWGVRRLHSNEPTSILAFAMGNFAPTPGIVMVRRAAFEAVGGFDVSAAPADDWDLWLRLTRHGAEMPFTPEVVLGYRLHDANASHRKDTMAAAEHYVWLKAVSEPSLSPMHRAMLRRAYRASHLQKCTDRLRRTASHLKRGAMGDGAREMLRAGHRLGKALTGSPA